MKPYVIIGNGAAAAACIEGVRSLDTKREIVVISAEAYPVYCRPLISYYLEGKTDPEKMRYRDPSFYETNRCRVLYGETAEAIDPAAKTVTLQSGETIDYHALCVAAGSSPFIPPIEGLDTVPQVHTFLTLADTLSLEQAVRPDARVLILGAGLIGLKCAEGLHGRVGSITVCDLADRVLSSILDAECAAPMQKRLEENGIQLLLGSSVAQFRGNTAVLQNGDTIPFDVLVCAVGVRANTSLIRSAGGRVGRGITVDDQMRTSLPHVYAAGDCTEGTDVSCGQTRVLALMPNAVMQGHCAGVNMAGGADTYDNAIPMNSISLFGLHAMTAGSYVSAADGGEMYEEKTADAYKRFFTQNDRLTGFILIGETERAGIYTSLVRNRTPLSSIRFDLLRKTASYTAFSAQARQEAFGGVV